MTQNQLSAFISKLKSDSSLQNNIKAASSAEAVSNVAKAAGFDINSAELLRYNLSLLTGLSDAELEKTAGNVDTFTSFAMVGCEFTDPHSSRGCAC